MPRICLTVGGGYENRTHEVARSSRFASPYGICETQAYQRLPGALADTQNTTGLSRACQHRSSTSSAGSVSALTTRTRTHARARVPRRLGLAQVSVSVLISLSRRNASEGTGTMAKGNKVYPTWTLLGRTRDGRRFRLTPGGERMRDLAPLMMRLNQEGRGKTWANFYISADQTVEDANLPVAHVILPGEKFPTQESVRSALEYIRAITVKKGGNYLLNEQDRHVRGMNPVLDEFGIVRHSPKSFEATRFVSGVV